MAAQNRAPLIRVLWTLWALAPAWAGCAGEEGLPTCVPGGCEGKAQCVVGRCRPPGAVPTRSESRRLVFEANDVAVVMADGERGDDGLIVIGRRADGDAVVLLSFPVELEADDEVEGAFLVFEPAAGAPPVRTAIALEVATITAPWSPDTASWGRQPKLGLPTEAGVARGRPTSPLRVDVTHLVRDWPDGPPNLHGLALLADGVDPFGAAYTSGLTEGRPPRLEVYVK